MQLGWIDNCYYIPSLMQRDGKCNPVGTGCFQHDQGLCRSNTGVLELLQGREAAGALGVGSRSGLQPTIGAPDGRKTSSGDIDPDEAAILSR